MSEPVHAPMPGAEPLAEPLRSRWSPTYFDAAHVLPRGDLATLLQAARWAPSQGNTQPWAYLVCERGSASHAVLVRHLSRGNSGWVPRASVVLVSAAQVGPDPALPPDGKPPRDPAYAFHDVGQAAAHVTLQARAMGLHAHQFSGFDQEGVAADLAVPDHYRVLAGIAVGRRGAAEAAPADAAADLDREARERRRRPLTDFAFGGRWGEPWSSEPGTTDGLPD